MKHDHISAHAEVSSLSAHDTMLQLWTCNLLKKLTRHACMAPGARGGMTAPGPCSSSFSSCATLCQPIAVITRLSIHLRHLDLSSCIATVVDFRVSHLRTSRPEAVVVTAVMQRLRRLSHSLKVRTAGETLPANLVPI